MMRSTFLAPALVGAPWSRDGMGPDSFSCWGLVRHVLRETRGLVLPEAAGDHETLPIMAMAREHGWRPAEGPMRDGDVVLMRNNDGERHVGIACAVGGRIAVLISNGNEDLLGRPHGCVELVGLADVREAFHAIELWRAMA